MKRTVAVTLLLVTTFFWGVTFTVVKKAVARVDVFVFLAQRFAMAAVLLGVIAVLRRGRLDSVTFTRGSVMGLFLFFSYVFQTMALRFTSASNTCFLSGASVVLVPLLGAIFFRQRVPPKLLAAVALAMPGLLLLTTNGTWSFNRGDALAVTGSVCIALHMLLTGRYASGSDVAWLTTVQIAMVAVASWVVATAAGHGVWVWHPFLLGPYVICVLFATVFAFLIQTAAQRFISSTHTALILCMEPVFAAFWAYGALGERLGPAGFGGAALILAGMLIAQMERPKPIDP